MYGIIAILDFISVNCRSTRLFLRIVCVLQGFQNQTCFSLKLDEITSFSSASPTDFDCDIIIYS